MRRSGRLALVGGCFAALAALGGGWAAGLRINTTASMPRGIWRVVPGEVRRGDAVVLCLASTVAAEIGRQRGYLGPGACPDGAEPLVQPIVALAGDRVLVGPDGIGVNEQALPGTAQLTHDSAGRVLEAVAHGAFVVRPGEVWAVATHDPRSWDSRYWGAIPASAIVARAVPMWVLP